MEKEVEYLVKCLRHVLQDKSWNPIRPRGLVVGVRRSASCIMGCVMWPVIIGTEEAGVARTWPRHGNGAPGGRVGFGESAIVSIAAIFFTTSGGSVMRNPVASSFMMERSVGSVLDIVFPVVVRSRDLRAIFGFLTNIFSRAAPYLARRTLRACFSRNLTAFLNSLKRDCTARAGGTSALC